MTPQEAIPILERLQEPEVWEPQISRDAYEALELAIEALEDREQIFHLECLRCKKPVGTYSRQTMEQVSYTHYSYCEDCLRKGLKMLKKQDALDKQSASSEQVGKDIKFPTIHCCREYDSIQDESGRMGFGVYDPKEKNIYIAGDVPKEIFLKALFHEVFHWVQDVVGVKFDENDANTFSDILYDAVDMFDDHGPELFGQKTIVEPGEVFVGESVLKEAIRKDDHIADDSKMVDQFREDTKKTDSERVSLSEKEKSNSFLKEPSEEGNSEMNCSDESETVTNYHDLISKRDVYLALVEKGQASKRYKLGETWELNGKEVREVLDALPSAQPEKIPYKKPEIICDPDCDGFVCSQNGIYGWCPKAERWGCEYFYELERRNNEID